MIASLYLTLKQQLIEIADQEILPRFERTQIDYKQDGSAVTETDLAMQNRLQALLYSLTPNIPLLGEEMDEEQQQLLIKTNPGGLWCLDPLDGTSNYASGFPFFAVSLALLKNNRAIFGIVYDPIRRECFMAVEGQGAWLNDRRLRCIDDGRALNKTLAVVDFKRLSPAVRHELIERPPYASQRSLGSVALDWCWLAANRYQLYLHGQQKAWDYTAGCLILREAAGVSSTLEAQPVDDGSLAPRSAVASNSKRLYESWMRVINQAKAKEKTNS